MLESGRSDLLLADIVATVMEDEEVREGPHQPEVQDEAREGPTTPEVAVPPGSAVSSSPAACQTAW